jgi:hypothetical protein
MSRYKNKREIPGEVSNDSDNIEYVETQKKESFIFKRNKTTGNYSIYDNNAKRIQLTINNVFLPFGLETYNDSDVLNLQLSDTNNYQHNNIIILKNINDKLESLANENPYLTLDGLEYYHILREDVYKNDKKNKKNKKDNKDIKKYLMRSYLKKGVNITHKQLFGTYDKRNLKSKFCNIVIELGSLWKNDKSYGCTIYVSSIKVLN